MRQDKILFIDTETGGLDPSNNSLLSIALVIWQESKIIESVEILINDGVMNVTQKALEINKINLEKHQKEALRPEAAISKFNQFLTQHFKDGEKITLGGHNINFDVNFLKAFLVSNGYNWHQRFSHRYVDTATILYYLYLAGKLDKKAISSQEAFDFFRIEVQDRHTAIADAIGTAKLFTILLKVIYSRARIKRSGKGDEQPDLFPDQN